MLRFERITSSLLGCAFACAATTAVEADTIHVPADQPTIQAGIDAAVNGDEVVVAPGTYLEAINLLGKAITVRSNDGPQTTIIDASTSAQSVIVCNSGEGAATIIDGFTLTGGSGTLHEEQLRGGGLFIIGSSPQVHDCRIIANGASYGGGVYLEQGNATFESCTFESNFASLGGAMCNILDAIPTILDCTFRENEATATDGGAIFNVYESHAVITGSTFIENSCPGWGGAIYNVDSSSPVITACTFIGNEAHFGGALTNHNFCDPVVVNCLFVGNKATRGGAMLNHSDGLPIVVNSTFVANSAQDAGGAICHLNNSQLFGHPSVDNSILRGNGPDQIAVIGSPQVLVSFSNVENGWAGTGNFDMAPGFVDADGPDDNPLTYEDNDYRLAAGSPAIDAGDNALVPLDIITDFDGNPRFVDDPDSPDCPQSPGSCGTAPIVDVGAFEYQPPVLCAADIAASAGGEPDGIVDVFDLLMLLENWGTDASGAAIAPPTNVVDVFDLLDLLNLWGSCE